MRTILCVLILLAAPSQAFADKSCDKPGNWRNPRMDTNSLRIQARDQTSEQGWRFTGGKNLEGDRRDDKGDLKRSYENIVNHLRLREHRIRRVDFAKQRSEGGEVIVISCFIDIDKESPARKKFLGAWCEFDDYPPDLTPPKIECVRDYRNHKLKPYFTVKFSIEDPND